MSHHYLLPCCLTPTPHPEKEHEKCENEETNLDALSNQFAIPTIQTPGCTQFADLADRFAMPGLRRSYSRVYPAYACSPAMKSPGGRRCGTPPH